MSNEKTSALHIVSEADRVRENPLALPPFEHSAIRDFTGINAPATSATHELLASAAQLEALMTCLKLGERLVAHLDFTTPKSSGLSIEIVGCGATQRAATARSTMLGGLLDAALASGLPCVDVFPRQKRRQQINLRSACLLAPSGVVLPLGGIASRARSGNDAATAYDWAANPRDDAIVFSPTASGAHLAGLGVAMAAIKTPLSIEVTMTRSAFDAALLKQIADVRGRIAERLHADPTRYVRDERYLSADKRLENLVVAGSGITLSVNVRSKRPLDVAETSALSAALFGTPQDEHQSGHLAALRALYPRDEAVHSFFGIVAAAIGPAIERSQVAVLDSLDGSVIGKVRSGQLIRMAVAVPRSHTYMIGRPGSGKSTLLLNLIMQDIDNGDAVVVIDPHGDLWVDIRDRIPEKRRGDVQLVHMGEPALQPKLNILELGPGDPAEARARVVDTLYQLVRRLMFSGLTIDATGPMFNKYFRTALMLLMEGEGPNARIQDFEKIFSDGDYRDELRTRPGVSYETQQQWNQILNVSGNDHSLDNVTPWITSKMTQITQSAILRPILGANTTDLNFDTVLSEKKVCLINLASGRIGAEASALLGGVLTHRLEQAAKRQESKALDQRDKASVYFDEFHTFASEFLRPLMAESRKYGLRVTLANQTLSQMVNNDIDGGIFREVLGNCANSIVFAIDVEDALYLSPRFGGKIDPVNLVSQPNYQAICQFQTKTAALGPFVVKTLPPCQPRKK